MADLSAGSRCPRRRVPQLLAGAAPVHPDDPAPGRQPARRARRGDVRPGGRLARVIANRTSTKVAQRPGAPGPDGRAGSRCARWTGRRWATLEGRARRPDGAGSGSRRRSGATRSATSGRRRRTRHRVVIEIALTRAMGQAMRSSAEASTSADAAPIPGDIPHKLQRRHRVQVTVTPLRGEAPERSITTGESRQALRGVAEMVLDVGGLPVPPAGGLAGPGSQRSFRTEWHTARAAAPPEAAADTGTPVRPRPRPA